MALGNATVAIVNRRKDLASLVPRIEHRRRKSGADTLPHLVPLPCLSEGAVPVAG